MKYALHSAYQWQAIMVMIGCLGATFPCLGAAGGQPYQAMGTQATDRMAVVREQLCAAYRVGTKLAVSTMVCVTSGTIGYSTSSCDVSNSPVATVVQQVIPVAAGVITVASLVPMLWYTMQSRRHLFDGLQASLTELNQGHVEQAEVV